MKTYEFPTLEHARYATLKHSYFDMWVCVSLLKLTHISQLPDYRFDVADLETGVKSAIYFKLDNVKHQDRVDNEVIIDAIEQHLRRVCVATKTRPALDPVLHFRQDRDWHDISSAERESRIYRLAAVNICHLLGGTGRHGEALYAAACAGNKISAWTRQDESVEYEFDLHVAPGLAFWAATADKFDRATMAYGMGTKYTPQGTFQFQGKEYQFTFHSYVIPDLANVQRRVLESGLADKLAKEFPFFRPVHGEAVGVKLINLQWSE